MCVDQGYSIYKLTSPSGRFYIGLTKMSIRERWRQHVARAHREDNHPLYNAIRKYSSVTFTVEVIDHAQDRAEAQKLEMHHIANSPKNLLYNLSPGGEADGEYGSHVFWERINSDPEARERYIQKLSDVKKSSDWSDYDAMQSKAQQWRKDNPKEAYKLAYRGVRLANKANVRTGVNEEPVSLKERLLRKHKWNEVTRRNAKALWARRTDEEREDVGAKISKSAQKRWRKVTDPAERTRLTQTARDSIDREKQGAAASTGLKKFWEDLRADPVRYEVYMERRTASLRKTIEKTDPAKRARHAQKARAGIDYQKRAVAVSKGVKKFWEVLRADPERYAEYMSKR